MKLIDKAQLMNHIESESRKWGEDYDSYQILGDIEDFGTIEAIPISWLEKCNFTLKLTDNTTIPINFIIENLIDIWRTEHE